MSFDCHNVYWWKGEHIAHFLNYFMLTFAVHWVDEGYSTCVYVCLLADNAFGLL